MTATLNSALPAAGDNPAASWPGDIEHLERRARELAGDPRLFRRYRDAVKVLRGDVVLGRPDEADAEAVERVLRLYEGGHARSIKRAAEMIAAAEPGYSEKATAIRLAGKARERQRQAR